MYFCLKEKRGKRGEWLWYIHRIGRTGRMARLGVAYSLVTEADGSMIRVIERLLGQRLERKQVAV
jgi:superfamily II DNA/RNA helicase